jgi:Zincin-like metallopeptidase
VHRLLRAALSLPLVLRSRIRDCLPLHVRDGIWAAAGERHNVIFDIAGAGWTQKWGDEGYAMEELVAELNAAFLSAVLGPTPSFREEHAAYIAGLHGFSSGSAQPLPQRKRKRPLPSSRSDPSGRAHSRRLRWSKTLACIKRT